MWNPLLRSAWFPRLAPAVAFCRFLTRRPPARARMNASDSPSHRGRLIRTVAAIAIVGGGTLRCADSPTAPLSSAEFVAADHDGRDGAGPGLALVDIQGQKYQRVGGPAGDPVWLPDGERVAFWRGEDVWIADLKSGTEHALIPPGGPLVHERSPQASRDGRWLYVMGCAVDAACDYELWRVTVTGADAGQVAEKVPVVPPPGNTAIIIRVQDVGRDGRLLVEYFTQSLDTGVERVLLAALDPATGALTDLPVYGESARWSPDGKQIAYVSNGSFYIAPTDGGAPREIRPQRLTAYDRGLSWSPDGRFILVHAIGGMHLIDVQQSTATPLTVAGSLYEPAWRPR